MRSPVGVGIKTILPRAYRMVGSKTGKNRRRLGTDGPTVSVRFYLFADRCREQTMSLAIGRHPTQMLDLGPASGPSSELLSGLRRGQIGDSSRTSGRSGQIGDSSRTSALGPGGPRFRRRAGRFAPQRPSCPLLQFRHEMVISERISGTSRRPNLICCVRSAGQRLAPIVRGTNFAPAPEINCSRWVPSLGMGPRARPRVLFGLPDQSGANRVQVHLQQRPNQVSPA